MCVGIGLRSTARLELLTMLRYGIALAGEVLVNQVSKDA